MVSCEEVETPSERFIIVDMLSHSFFLSLSNWSQTRA